MPTIENQKRRALENKVLAFLKTRKPSKLQIMLFLNSWAEIAVDNQWAWIEIIHQKRLYTVALSEKLGQTLRYEGAPESGVWHRGGTVVDVDSRIQMIEEHIDTTRGVGVDVVPRKVNAILFEAREWKPEREYAMDRLSNAEITHTLRIGFQKSA